MLARIARRRRPNLLSKFRFSLPKFREISHKILFRYAKLRTERDVYFFHYDVMYTYGHNTDTVDDMVVCDLFSNVLGRGRAAHLGPSLKALLD